MIWDRAPSLFDRLIGREPHRFWEAVPRDDPKLAMMEELMSDDPTWMEAAQLAIGFAWRRGKVYQQEL